MFNKKLLKYNKISTNAYIPSKATESSAGYDLYSAYKYVVPKKGKELILTDICLEIPFGCYGRIAPRSGLAWNNFIDVGAGVVDCDYRGNVAVILFNFSDEDFIVNKGDRIAQLICECIADTELIETSLNPTVRNNNGFGSTGI